MQQSSESALVDEWTRLVPRHEPIAKHAQRLPSALRTELEDVLGRYDGMLVGAMRKEYLSQRLAVLRITFGPVLHGDAEEWEARAGRVRGSASACFVLVLGKVLQ